MMTEQQVIARIFEMIEEMMEDDAPEARDIFCIRNAESGLIIESLTKDILVSVREV